MGGLANGASTRSMACGTGLVCQLAKLVPDIAPITGGGGACVNTRVTCPPSAPDSRWVAIMFSRTAGWVSTRLRLIESGSK